MKSLEKVSIIILNWNGLKDTLECLESVFKLDYPNFEVIVVDNGSTDNSVEEVKRSHPGAILIENGKNLGFTGGNNIAMRHAMKRGADYLWLLNNDTTIEPDTLAKLVEVSEKFPEVGMISPVIRFYYKPKRIQFAGGYIHLKQQKTGYSKAIPKESSTRHIYCDFLWGAALLIKRKVIEDIGYFDERFFAYSEDVDLSMRAVCRGHRSAIASNCNIFHKDAGSSEGRTSVWYCYLTTRNRFLLWTKHITGFSKIKFIVKNYVPSVLRNFAGLKRLKKYGEAEASLAGCWNAFRGNYGSWEGSIEVPNWLSFFFNCHPLFWALFFEGNYKEMYSELRRRFKKNISIKYF
jgi:GT2 family glycosyltransferase